MTSTPHKEKELATLCISVLLAFLLAGCGSSSNQASKEVHSASIKQHASVEEITARVESARNLRESEFYRSILPHRTDVKIEPPAERFIKGALHLKGHVEPEFGKETDVSAHVSGRITELRVKPGQSVSEGNVLAMIDSREISELQAEVLEAKSKLEISQAQEEREDQIYKDQLRRPKGLMEAQAHCKKLAVLRELAESEFKRQEGLYREKIVSAKDYMRARANLSSLKVESDLANAELQRQQQMYDNHALMKKDLQLAQAETTRWKRHLNTLLQRLTFLGMDKSMQKDLLDSGKIDGEIRLLAPVSGITSHLDLAIGEVVDPERSLMKITDLSHVLVEVAVPEINSPQIKLGSKVSIKFVGYPGKTFHSTISFVGEHVHAPSHTVSCRARLDNLQHLLKANMEANVNLEEEPRTVLAVPIAAVQKFDGKDVVFVESENGYKMREVNLGAQDARYVEVSSGLTPDDKVVAIGSRDLMAALSYHHK